MIAFESPSDHRSARATDPEPPSGHSGQPASPTVASAAVPVAWYGRVATHEEAGVMLTLQLCAAQRALPPEYSIVATFFDVGSGRLTPQEHGRRIGQDGLELSLTRDGGIADLLDEARRPDRRFVAVACESIERLARPTYLSAQIEHGLEQAGVALLVADEGIDRPATSSLNDATGTTNR